MPTVVVPANISACSVDIPEKIKDGDEERTVERSCVIREKRDADGNLKRTELARTGSLRVRPASTLTITDDEWACFKKCRPDIAKRLIVVEERDPAYGKQAPIKAAKRIAAAEAKAKAEAKEAAAVKAKSESTKAEPKPAEPAGEKPKKKPPFGRK